MAIQTLESDVRTNVDHVHCFSCKAVVSIHEILDSWADLTERDMCVRCAGPLFCLAPIVLP